MKVSVDWTLLLSICKKRQVLNVVRGGAGNIVEGDWQYCGGRLGLLTPS